MIETIRVSPTNSSTPGTDSNTYVMFDSTVTFGVGIDGDVRNETLIAHEISRVIFTLDNNQAGTLKAYRSIDKGLNWKQVGGDIVVPIAGATDVNGPYDFLTDAHPDFRISWVNGGVAQTTWRPSVTMLRNYHGAAI
jgi:hypothetical protein